MQTNTQFAVAIHALTLIELFPAWGKEHLLSSGAIAESVRTNPVVIRRVMGLLRDAGLARSQPGPGGGWKLSRPADEINLRDIFRAVQEESLFAMPRQEPSAECPVGAWLPSVLVACFKDAEAALVDRLAEVSIADVVASVKAEFSCVWEPGLESEASVSPARGQT
jgi:Rrf2 family protein